MKTALLLLFVAYPSAWSMDCAGMAEGLEVRIDNQVNGSLARGAIQDQDGIGSCYANQASLLLQTVIPNNPNLSYLNLGLFYTQEKSLASSRATGDKFFTRDGKTAEGVKLQEFNSAIHGGFACDTINLAKLKQKDDKVGGICRSEDVNLEHNFFDDKTKNHLDQTHNQEKSLSAASRYMNAFQHKFGFASEEGDKRNLPDFIAKRRQADEFRKALTNYVNRSSDDYMLKNCSQPNPEKTAKILNNTIARAFLANEKCYSNKLKMRTDTAECKSFEKFGYIIGRSSGPGNPMRAAFEVSNSIQKKMSDHMNELYKSEGGFAAFLSGLGNMLSKLDSSKGQPIQKEKFINNIVNHISPADLKELEGEYKRVALKEIDDCKATKVLDYFQDKEEFIKNALEDKVLCRYSDLLQRASDMAGVLPPKTFNNMSSFLDFLTTKAGLDYDRAMLDFIARDCSPDKRIKIPESVTCDHKLMSFKPDDFPGADGLSNNAKAVISENRTKMMANLQGNRAVGLDICTKFWGDTNYDWNKDVPATKNTTCQASGKHGFHAITMIGYRCKDNRIQYLSQNSWGPNWKVDGFEMDNGKIWMDEDKVFKNLQGVNYIGP